VTNDELIRAWVAAKSKGSDVDGIIDVAAIRKRIIPMPIIIAPMAVSDPRSNPNSDPSSPLIRIPTE